MARKKGQGRKKPPGFALRATLRYLEGIHPPEVGELLRKAAAAPPQKRSEIIMAAIIGGAKAGAAAAENAETAAVGAAVDDWFGIY